MAKQETWVARLDPISEFISPTFRSEKNARAYLNQMLRLYKAQGYYSSPVAGRVPFADLNGRVERV